MRFVTGGIHSTAPWVSKPKFSVAKIASALLTIAVVASAVSAYAQAPAGNSSSNGGQNSTQTSSTPIAGLAPVATNVADDENFHYDNLWELSAGLAYAGMPSGVSVQHRAQLAGLKVNATQWVYPRWGATADLRSYVGLGDTNVNAFTVNSPLFVEYFGSVGPEFRWVRTPAIGITLHALAGGGHGTFNYHVPGGVENNQLGVYNNGSTFDIISGGNIDFNTPSGFGVRVSPEMVTTRFNSDLRNSFGISVGAIWRFGKF